MTQEVVKNLRVWLSGWLCAWLCLYAGLSLSILLSASLCVLLLLLRRERVCLALALALCAALSEAGQEVLLSELALTNWQWPVCGVWRWAVSLSPDLPWRL